MNYGKAFKFFFVSLLTAGLLTFFAWTGENSQAEERLPSSKEMINLKPRLQDKFNLVDTHHPSKILPSEMWSMMHFDVEKMKTETAEILGFSAPETVGKIAPEIKPGKYTYQDLEQNPGFKELFPPVIYNNIKKGGPPLAARIMDFEIIPTQQFHWSLPICEATKKNLGKTKLDKDGYIVKGSWEGGVPFPRPAGDFMAQQIFYNFYRRAQQWDFNYMGGSNSWGFGRNLNIDKKTSWSGRWLKLMGRVFLPPFGWFDERAEENGEYKAYSISILSPRSMRGMVTLTYEYDDPYKMDPTMIYIPSMRRIRKMSSTDTQDPRGDMTYDDANFLSQKISPERFPYKFEIIEEREYLLPFSYGSAKAWVDTNNGYAFRNVPFMRRPAYVLQMTSLDPNYCYSKRIYYLDKETSQPSWAEFYDQKGRLYRDYFVPFVFMPKSGQVTSYGQPNAQVDYIDLHSTLQPVTYVPVKFKRSDLTIQHLIKEGK